MIAHPVFRVEPWAVRETELDLDVLAQTESVFALSNGHIGLRANLDEGEPHAFPGTYVNSFYEARPLPYAEAGYGYPESGQTIVNVTDGKIIRLLVDDEPFDIRYGRLVRHERVLDLRAGVLERWVEWCSPSGTAVRVTSTRMVSFVQRGLAAIRWVVEPVEGPVRVVAQSELVANQPIPAQSADPRAAAALASPLESEDHGIHGERIVLVHRTSRSNLRLAAGMDHMIDGASRADVSVESHADLGRVTVATDLQPGERLQIVKLIAYGYSSRRSLPSLSGQVSAALAEGRHTGWDGLVEGQRAYLDRFWEVADVEIDGDAEIQQAVRFALFHILQAGARAEQRAIPAKGLTGAGYDGHAFWDTESFVLPVLTYTAPHAAADALRWRHATIDLARERARQLGLAGATFPWRTIRGQECSAYWPAGTAAFHIDADIAGAVSRYLAATQDEDFAREVGVELLVETARLWRSLGHHDVRGRFRIDGVTGPDEYSALVDNNVYTNLMAQRNLRSAADAVERDPHTAERLEVDAEETASWRDAATAMTIPYDEVLQVHSQGEGLTRHDRWNFAATRPDQYPLLLHFPYFDLYRKQVVKQADLVLALHVCGDAFTDEEKARNFDYYEPLTVRDSSLSASTQAVVAAEVGHLDLAYDYCWEAARMDLDDLEHNTRDGVHIASLAGAWLALVAGFGGMRDHGGHLSFKPRLPQALARVAFGLLFRGRSLRVEVRSDSATYQVEGDPLDVRHYDERLSLSGGRSVTRPIPPTPRRPPPRQPPGREPRPRTAQPAAVPERAPAARAS
jgi:alpha,alpha-trehalose phosphorylase